MKFIIPSVVFFLLIMGCSNSDTPIEDPIKEFLLPTLTTTAVSDITDVSVVSGGNVTDDGGASITARGICLSTLPGPTILDIKTTDGTGKGEYDSFLQDLESNTSYYLRAYATNSKGTAYGNEISFKTIEPKPVVKVYEGDVFLATQQEVEDFGKQEYTEINGFLIVNDTVIPSSINDLSPLESLVKINGDFIIRENDVLKNIEGFNNLVAVNGGFTIFFNYNLELINGFNQLEVVEKWFNLVKNNNSINFKLNVNGFRTLNYIGGDLILSDIDNISPFPALTTIGESIAIASINKLTDLSIISRVTELNDNFAVIGNPNLLSLEGLNTSINSVNGTLNISNNFSLENLSGLKNIILMESLHIIGNPLIQSLKGLASMDFVVMEKVMINENISLQTLDGLQSIMDTGFKLEITNNEKLVDISSLSHIKSLGNEEVNSYTSLFIAHNNSLENLTGLEALETVSGYLKIMYNEKLKNLDGLLNLNTVGVLDIQNNLSLDDFCGIKTIFDKTSRIMYNKYNPDEFDFANGDCSSD